MWPVGVSHSTHCKTLRPSAATSSASTSLYRTIFLLPILLQFSLQAAANVQKSYDVNEGVVDKVAKLRCRATKYLKSDSPVLVLWYKDGARLPFFTLDLRDGGPEEFFDDSMRSRVNSDVTGEFLTLRNLVVSDSALYKCKVDYHHSPSLEAKVKLIVYQPPTQMLIQDESKRVYTGPILGPINQGAKLRLFCIAIGGSPTSSVSWWIGSTLYNDKSINLGSLLSSQEANNLVTHSGSVGSSRPLGVSGFGVDIDVHAPRVVSELNIFPVKRSHAGANITCQANNNNISKPMQETFNLNVYLRPESVVILVPKEPLRENRSTRLKCETLGSYPPAKVSWEKSKSEKGKPIILESKQSNVKEGKTISWLTITPTAEDHGTILTCRAINPSMPVKGITKSTVLQVQYAPRVHLQLGKNLLHRSIKEGEDVYFECEISCNPRQTTISWHKDNLPVEQNLSAGILLSGENLVLQRINRQYAGNYTCSAENELGSTSSNVVHLPIMYLPVCKTVPVTVAVAEEEAVKLECHVNSRPSNDLKFVWLFNNTLDTVEVESYRIKIEGPFSYIDYTPLTSRDYGTLSCWATNEVGMQAEPCRFTIVEAGPPERVKNCVLVNHTVGSLEVRCSPGANGGSSQKFVAKVFSTVTHTLLAELKSKVPRFHVTGLTPGQDYLVTVTAVNEKGSSEPEEIDAVRLKVAEKRMGDVKNPPVSPLVGVFIGLVGGFILLLLVGLLLSRLRSNRRSYCWSHKRENESTSGQIYSEPPIDGGHIKVPNHLHSQMTSSPISRSTLHDEEEDSPDLVKSSNETSHLINSRKCPDMITRRHTYIPSPDSIPSPLNGSGSIGPFLESQSPIHLPSDESFV